MIGMVLSSTVMVWVQLAVLPQLSVAVKVLVTLKIGFGQAESSMTSTQLTEKTPQASETVPPELIKEEIVVEADVNENGKPEVAIVMAFSLQPSIGGGDAGQVIAGIVESATIKICSQVLTLPQASVAVKVLVTVMAQLLITKTSMYFNSATIQSSLTVPPALSKSVTVIMVSKVDRSKPVVAAFIAFSSHPSIGAGSAGQLSTGADTS